VRSEVVIRSELAVSAHIVATVPGGIWYRYVRQRVDCISYRFPSLDANSGGELYTVQRGYRDTRFEVN